jgi:hypothetical protein
MLALPFFNRITATQQQEVAEVLGDAILSLRISSEAAAQEAPKDISGSVLSEFGHSQ